MKIIEINKKKFGPPSASQKREVEDGIKKLRKDGERMVKGMFEFVDAPGGWLDFSYRFLPGDPIRTVKISHGEIVDIPWILAKHLNNVYKKVRVMPQDMEKGGGSVTKFSRTRFIQMDMMEDPLHLEKPILIAAS